MDDSAEEKAEGDAMPKQWIKSATDKMKSKGTIGAFGKATPKKIAAGIKKGGLQEKRAIFAKNMKSIAKKNNPSKKA